MKNQDPNQAQVETRSEKAPGTPRPHPFHRCLRRVERTVEYVALTVHVYVIVEGVQHMLGAAIA